MEMYVLKDAYLFGNHWLINAALLLSASKFVEQKTTWECTCGAESGTYIQYIHTYINSTWYVFLRTPLLTSIYVLWQAASAIEEYQKILSTPEGDSGASEEGK